VKNITSVRISYYYFFGEREKEREREREREREGGALTKPLEIIFSCS